MTSKIKKSAFWGGVIALMTVLVAFDAFIAVMMWNHGFPTEIFKSDLPNWRRRVVFTWSDAAILGLVCLGHLFVAWTFLRRRSRRARRPNTGFGADVRL